MIGYYKTSNLNEQQCNLFLLTNYLFRVKIKLSQSSISDLNEQNYSF